MITRITQEKYEWFVDNYIQNQMFTIQRFGQAFLNHFCPGFECDVKLMEIFNETSIKTAMDLVQQHCVLPKC
jgi:hypothetical protein